MQSGRMLEEELFLLKQKGTFLDMLRVHPLFYPSGCQSGGLLSSPSGHELRKNLKLAEMTDTII